MSMDHSFWKMFWRSFRKSYGALVVILSVPLALLLWYFPSTTQVPLGPIVVISMPIIAMLATFAHMACSVSQELAGRIPRVIHSRKGTGAFKAYCVVCLLGQSELFSHDVAVSFYLKDSGGFEVLIGIGRVLNVQDDRRIQVGLEQVAEGQQDIVSSLQGNNSETLQQLIVKPSVPAFVMNSGSGGGIGD